MTFIRPDVTRGRFHQTAPEVDIRSGSTARTDVFNLVQAAQVRLMSGDSSGALAAAGRALRIDGSSAQAHSLYAQALDALGRERESGVHHRRAAELMPDDGAMLNTYGIWLCSTGKPGEALPWFDKAAAAPGYATPDAAVANAADCAARAGQLDRAARDARRVLAEAPVNPVALMAMARVKRALGERLEARAFIERRLDSAPADREALLLASQIEQELGDRAAAERYVRRIRAEFPRTSNSAETGGDP
ncbi:MAG: type IV pilus biogenesis/stability protein PilW [Lysobacter sp.]|nr:MAG: type IV pilus biogenesis/stability protein PilW [Lysobacter sp.]